MKAATIVAFGSADQIEIADIPPPTSVLKNLVCKRSHVFILFYMLQMLSKLCFILWVERASGWKYGPGNIW